MAFTGKSLVKPGEMSIDVQVKVQGFMPLPRPAFHRHFSRPDQQNVGVVPNECCLPSLLYNTSSSSTSRGSTLVFRR
ncbi:hypothetical protein HAX54_000680, partial [Datura stramonium]|nr:hypothetical protein [Datura stramonium]